MYMEKRNLTMKLIANKAVQAGWARVRLRSAPATTAMPHLSHQKATPNDGSCLSAAFLSPFHLPTEVTVVPLDGEICSNLGSIKGVKEEQDLCFWSVLLAD